MVELLQRALEHHGIEDRIEAAGQFSPRGQTGGMFAGGLVAGELVGRGVAGGYSGLPETMLIGVSAGAVYGFAARSRSKEPTVRVLELIHEDSQRRDSGPERVGPDGDVVVALGAHGARQRAAQVLTGRYEVEDALEVIARGPAKLLAGL